MLIPFFSATQTCIGSFPQGTQTAMVGGGPAGTQTAMFGGAPAGTQTAMVSGPAGPCEFVYSILIF